MPNVPTSITSSLPGSLVAVLPGIIAFSLLAGLPDAHAYRPVERSFTGDEPPKREIGVVSLDDSEPTSWMVELGDLYDEPDGPEIVGGPQLVQRIEHHQIAGERRELPDQLQGISEQLDRGIEAFFGEGSETAIEELSTVFEHGTDHVGILARRPDLAAEIYQAGTVLVRAYRDLGQPQGARGIARDLYRYFPGREPSLSVATGEDLRFFYVERAHVAKTGAELTIQTVGDSDCTRYINGTTIDERTIKVASEISHYLTVRCGEEWGPVWQVTLQPGEYATLPLAEQPPLEFSLNRSTYRQRRRAADYLRLITHWSDVSEIVGVGRPAEASGPDGNRPYVVMRIAPDGKATWARVDSRKDVDNAIRELMPDLRAAPAPETTHGLESLKDLPWRNFALLSTGATAILGGTLLSVLTETGALGLSCASSLQSYCSTTSMVTRRPTTRLTLARVTYATALAAGAGLTTWGLIRQLRPAPRRRTADLTARAPRFSIQPRDNGATALFEFAW